MDEAEATKQVSPGIERLAMQRARDKANMAKWDLNIAIFLFAVLIIVMILLFQGVGIGITAPVAVFGLAMIWLEGWRREKKLYKFFYEEELASLQKKPAEEAATLVTRLTPREIETVNYMAQGYSNKLIANEFGIGEQTIKNFVSGILTKLNAHDRTEAVVIAIKQGLISIE
jgi:DNA-binding CsgD family transcriptional regulator